MNTTSSSTTSTLLRRAKSSAGRLRIPKRWRWRWSYLRWRIGGSRPFSEEYVEQVASKIDAGIDHGTLSVNFVDPELAARTATFVTDTLRDLGIEESDDCVEYGCGALRIGEHVMPMLHTGGYFGLDVTDRFWNNGLVRLGPEFVDRYRPRLELIPDDTSELGALDVRFLLCIAVFIHVPPPELDDFVRRVAGAMGEHTTLVLDARLGDRAEQVHQRTWRHARERALELFDEHGLRTVAPSPVRRDGLIEELWILGKAPSLTGA